LVQPPKDKLTGEMVGAASRETGPKIKGPKIMSREQFD
jgi:hypothetical protein